MANTPQVPIFEDPCVIQPPESFYTTDQESLLNPTRNDKFQLVMNLPCVLQNLIKKDSKACNIPSLDRLEMMIWGYVIPEVAIEVIKQEYSGQTLKFSGLSRPEYAPVTVNFTVDSKFQNYFIIWKWLNLQNDQKDSQYDARHLNPASKGHLPEYSNTFSIIALNPYNVPTAKWDFRHAFPVSLGAINSSSRDGKELDTTFTFEFSQLEMSLLEG